MPAKDITRALALSIGNSLAEHHESLIKEGDPLEGKHHATTLKQLNAALLFLAEREPVFIPAALNRIWLVPSRSGGPVHRVYANQHSCDCARGRNGQECWALLAVDLWEAALKESEDAANGDTTPPDPG